MQLHYAQTVVVRPTQSHCQSICKAVIDVGCGPGNITFEKVLPLLPKTTKKLIGVDISPAQIEYAKSNYGEDPRISYQELDVASNILATNFIGNFDLVLSLYCLHCIEDQSYKFMLKPGGKLLISSTLNPRLSDLYQFMYENPKWSKYMTNYKSYFVTRSAQYYRNLFNEIGFDKVEVGESDDVYVYSEEETFGVLATINMFEVPEDLMKEYIQDQVNYLFKFVFSSVDEKGQKRYHWRITSIIITAFKPR